LKSTETPNAASSSFASIRLNFSNFGSLKSTETSYRKRCRKRKRSAFQQFRLVEEH